MKNKEIEEKIYEYGHLQYRVGRMETDEKAGMKEYIKIVDQKNKILNEIVNFFKTKQNNT